MSVPMSMFRHQGAVLRALGQAAFGGQGQGSIPPLPGPERVSELPPRDDALVDAYVRHLGCEPGAWAGEIPPHLFPQWTFPISGQVLATLPFPLAKTLNAGCALTVRGPIPRGEPLIVRARLTEVDDDGRRVLIKQRITTSTPSSEGAIEAELTALVPLKRGGKGDGGDRGKKDRPIVPEGAKELARWDLDRWAGLDFAKLTGDVNPIHWVGPYARMAGFKGVILHGFSTFARAFEGLRREVGPISKLEVRFTRPVPLPSQPGLFIDDRGGVFVGERPGEPACMTGDYTERDA